MNDWLSEDKIEEKMNQLDDYFSELPTKDISSYPEPKRSIIKKFQDAMNDSNRGEADW
jgi:hypothetical protein